MDESCEKTGSYGAASKVRFTEENTTYLALSLNLSLNTLRNFSTLG